MTYTPTAWVDFGVPCIDAVNLNNIEAGIDRAQGDVMLLRGATAARPASDPLLIGRLYFATDAPYEISRDNGGGWDRVGYTDDIFTALGTLMVGSGAGAAGPLGIGAGGEVLTVVGGTAAWAVPAGGAWTLIQEQILGAPAATVTFAAIPGTYRALVLFTNARTATAAELDQLAWRANADAGANYDWGSILGRETIITNTFGTRGVNEAWFAEIEGNNSTANTFGVAQTIWLGYALADRYKRAFTPAHSVFGDLSADDDIRQRQVTGQWRNTNAITSLTILTISGANIMANSIFALYGIT